jgi:hypothetical protein
MSEIDLGSIGNQNSTVDLSPKWPTFTAWLYSSYILVDVGLSFWLCSAACMMCSIGDHDCATKDCDIQFCLKWHRSTSIGEPVRYLAGKHSAEDDARTKSPKSSRWRRSGRDRQGFELKSQVPRGMKGVSFPKVVLHSIQYEDLRRKRELSVQLDL